MELKAVLALKPCCMFSEERESWLPGWAMAMPSRPKLGVRWALMSSGDLIPGVPTPFDRVFIAGAPGGMSIWKASRDGMKCLADVAVAESGESPVDDVGIIRSIRPDAGDGRIAG